MNIKTIPAMLVLTMSVLACSAQNSKFNIGIEGGGGFASLRLGRWSDFYINSRAGYAAGLSFQYNFSNMLALRSGCYFERKGNSFSYDYYYRPGHESGLTTYDYLSVPLLFRATFGKKVKYFINAGPYLGILLYHRWHTDPNDQGRVRHFSMTDWHDKADAGLSAGAGLLFKMKEKLTLSFELRNNLGLRNIFPNNDIVNSSVRTNAVNLMAGISFSLGATRSE
jgi:opacity protein-like surface antigen